MGWPSYESGVIEYQDGTQTQTFQVDGHDVVLQLWRGWCPRFLDIKGMPGGIGAEFGVYRRIPGQLKNLLGLPVDNGAISKKLAQLLPKNSLVDDIQNATYRSKLRMLLDKLGTVTQSTIDTIDAQMFWPFTELDITIESTLTNPTTGVPLFTAGPEKTWWLTKWMDLAEYNQFAVVTANQAPSMLNTWDYDMEFKITCKTQTQSGVWKKGDNLTKVTSVGGFGIATFGRL
jgi:hypothetical protein